MDEYGGFNKFELSLNNCWESIFYLITSEWLNNYSHRKWRLLQDVDLLVAYQVNGDIMEETPWRWRGISCKMVIEWDMNQDIVGIM